MSARSLARFILLTLLCIVIVSMATTWLARLAVSHSTQRFSQVVAGNIDVDVLVAGNSRAINLLIADGSAPTVFNLGYNGLYRADTLALVRDFFAAGNTAAVTLIEISALAGEKDRTYCRLRPYWSQMSHLREVARKGCSDEFKQGRILPLLNFNSEVFLRALHYLLINRRSDQDWINDYMLNDENCAITPVWGVEAIRKSFLETNKASLQSELQGLEAWLRQRRIQTRIVLVLAPFLVVDQSRQAVTDIKTASEDLFGAANYLDLGTTLSTGCKDFADTNHLSRSGIARLRAQIVSLVLPSPPE